MPPDDTILGNDMNAAQSWLMDSENRERLLGISRLILLFSFLLIFDLLGNLLFEHIDATAQAIHYKQINPFYRWVPLRAMEVLTIIFNGQSLRYVIAPLVAIGTVLLAGIRYVQDIYQIESFWKTAHYVLSSMFGVFYPRLVIDEGKPQVDDESEHSMLKIGGPGFLLIEPGNAVLLEHLTHPSRVLRAGHHFMTRFETIGFIANLHDQKKMVDQIETVTQDGIRVRIHDINVSFRVMTDPEYGPSLVRTAEEPYPLVEEALKNAAYNLSVDARGPDAWQNAVMRVVLGELYGFVNHHNIDYLTAPRTSPQDPRREIRERLMDPSVAKRFNALGAELLWVDIGHFDIVEEGVDESRIGYWQAQLAGNASVTRAYGEAKRMAYREMGRAEGQAELIMSIVQALQDVNMTQNPDQNLEEILLLRTAQILDSISESDLPSPEQKKLTGD